MQNQAVPDGREYNQNGNPAHPDTILIGLGNPILGDDGIGWRVVQEIEARLRSLSGNLAQGNGGLDVEIEYLSLGGLSLMERLMGYQTALIIDAVVTGRHAIGEVIQFSLEDLQATTTSHLASSHDTNLGTAIKMGRSLGISLPSKIMIIGIEARTTFDFSENLSPDIEAAIPSAVGLALDLLHRLHQGKISPTKRLL